MVAGSRGAFSSTGVHGRVALSTSPIPVYELSPTPHERPFALLVESRKMAAPCSELGIHPLHAGRSKYHMMREHLNTRGIVEQFSWRTRVSLPLILFFLRYACEPPKCMDPRQVFDLVAPCSPSLAKYTSPTLHPGFCCTFQRRPRAVLSLWTFQTREQYVRLLGTLRHPPSKAVNGPFRKLTNNSPRHHLTNCEQSITQPQEQVPSPPPSLCVVVVGMWRLSKQQ